MSIRPGASWIGVSTHRDGYCCAYASQFELAYELNESVRWRLSTPSAPLLYVDVVADRSGRELVAARDGSDGAIVYSDAGAPLVKLVGSFADNPIALGLGDDGEPLLVVQTAARKAVRFRFVGGRPDPGVEFDIPETTQGFVSIYRGLPVLKDGLGILTINGEPLNMWRASDDERVVVGERFFEARSGVAAGPSDGANFLALRGFAFRPDVARINGRDAYAIAAGRAGYSEIVVVAPPWPPAPVAPTVAPIRRRAIYGYFNAISTRYQDNPAAPQNVTVINDDDILPARCLSAWPGRVVVGTTLIDRPEVVAAWDRVQAVFCEASDAVSLMRLAQAAKRRIAGLGLAPRIVIGIWDTGDDPADPPTRVADVDAIGLEIYPPLPNRPAAEAIAIFERRMARTETPIVAIGGAYDRNGEYDDADQIVELQRYWEVALRRFGVDRLLGVLLYSDGRSGGTRDYDDKWRLIHKAQFAALEGPLDIGNPTTEPEEPQVPEPTPPPVVVNFRDDQALNIDGRIHDSFVNDLKRPNGLYTVPDTEEYRQHPEYVLTDPVTGARIDLRGLSVWHSRALKYYQDYQGQPGDPYERAAVQMREDIKNSDEGRRARGETENPR